MYKGYRARAKGGKGQLSPLSMAGDENVQYLGWSSHTLFFSTATADYHSVMALVWLFASQTPLAMLPFAVYSVFHVATYTRGMLIPILQNPSAGGSQPSALSNAIGRFVKDYYDASMSVVAALEIALWFRLLFSALLFQRGSWILLVIYSVFVRARITQSSFVQGVIRHLGTRGDALAARQDVPPAARNAWVQMKGVAGKAHDATDVQRYVSTNAPAVKKSS